MFVFKDQFDSVESMDIEENNTSETIDISQLSLSDVPTLKDRVMNPFENWFLLDKKWYDNFVAYLQNSKNDPPGRIDNSCKFF